MANVTTKKGNPSVNCDKIRSNVKFPWAVAVVVVVAVVATLDASIVIAVDNEGVDTNFGAS